MRRLTTQHYGPYSLYIPAGARATIDYFERRDPHREQFKYTSSYDPRIRILERRRSIFINSHDTWTRTIERRIKQRRAPGGGTPERLRRAKNRRKA